MFLYSSKKLKVVFQYQERLSTVNMETYHTVKNAKEIAMKIFSDIGCDPQIFIFNKDVTLEEHLKLGDLAKGRSSIEIKIVKSELKKQLSYTVIKTKCGKTEVSKIKKTEDKKNSNKCNCGEDITHICINCKEFICTICKVASHSMHSVIKCEVNNLEESIKLYSISLQAELSNNLAMYKAIDKEYKKNILIDFVSRKEMIIRKLDKIEAIFEHTEDQIHKRKFELFEQITNTINQKIEKCLENLTYDLLNHKKRLGLDTVTEYMSLISSNKGRIDELAKEVSLRKEEFDTSKQIHELFNQLDKLIDEITVMCQNNQETYVKGHVGFVPKGYRNHQELRHLMFYEFQNPENNMMHTDNNSFLGSSYNHHQDGIKALQENKENPSTSQQRSHPPPLVNVNDIMDEKISQQMSRSVNHLKLPEISLLR